MQSKKMLIRVINEAFAAMQSKKIIQWR